MKHTLMICSDSRNTFESDSPEAMTVAIAAIIHDDAPVDEAMAILN